MILLINNVNWTNHLFNISFLKISVSFVSIKSPIIVYRSMAQERCSFQRNHRIPSFWYSLPRSQAVIKDVASNISSQWLIFLSHKSVSGETKLLHLSGRNRQNMYPNILREICITNYLGIINPNLQVIIYIPHGALVYRDIIVELPLI